MRYSVSRSFVFGMSDTIIKDEQGNDCFKLTNNAKVGLDYELLDLDWRTERDIHHYEYSVLEEVV